MTKTWDEVKTFDDIITAEERKIIDEIGAKHSCPLLAFAGKYFTYCTQKATDIKDMKPSPTNPIYQAHVGVVELQMFCKGDFKNCYVYKALEDSKQKNKS